MASQLILSVKNVSLLALVVQQVGLVLLIRYSRTTQTRDASSPYITSVAVVCAECLKFALNWVLQLVFEKQENDPKQHVWNNLITWDAAKLFVPASLYLIQNNLLFVALSNLPVPLYQVTNQGKLITTALCSRYLLQKKISWWQYTALALLAVGVALVNMGAASSSNHKETTTTMTVEQNQFLGFMAILISCFTSGFAGVYFEKLLKQSNDNRNQGQTISVYVRNCQLAFWSIGLGTIPILATHDFHKILQNGLFQGYNPIVWTVIVFQALTGLIVALVMKYGDTILKGFATSVAVVLATLISFFIWGDDMRLDHYFALGAICVGSAVHMYTNTVDDNMQKCACASVSATLHSLGCRNMQLIALLAVFTLSNLSHSNPGEIYFGSIIKYAPDTHRKHDGDVRVCNSILADINSTTRIPPQFENLTVDFPAHISFKPMSALNVQYLRNHSEWEERRAQTLSCSSSIEVLEWIMNRVNCLQGTLVVAYGELIHMNREKTLLKPDGTYFDDDFDTWVTGSTFQMVVNWEPLLWDTFGWSIRTFRHRQGATMFGQIFSVCGHVYRPVPQKAKAAYPAIEMYIVQNTTGRKGQTILRDNWQGTQMPPSWFFPAKPLSLGIPQMNKTLLLQIPAKHGRILWCLYGNWTVPSSEHAGIKTCV
eukprot:Nitzschia sp. Nitz4//scaffold482_size5428//1374//3338//NITZ4_009225-RA/size5428-processed-gene-0.3-mRNA-1//-1//CDS//3329552875//534//frame0